MLCRLPATLVVARWLGPWAPSDGAPPDVDREELVGTARGRSVRLWRYAPRTRARGAVVLALGLHYDGPADPRADRLARVLASAGAVVLVPFVPSYMALRLDEAAIEDFLAATAFGLDHAGTPPGPAGTMSISFGSLLALRAASDPELAHRIARVVTFGGYADVRETLRFALHGPPDRAGVSEDLGRNLPVVYLQLLPHLGLEPDASETLAEAWLTYVRGTWPDGPLAHDRDAQAALAWTMAESLPDDLRPTFLQGCAADPTGLDRALGLLPLLAADHLDARPYLGTLRADVDIVHGADDVVIPVSQVEALRSALPPTVRVAAHVTGLASHTGALQGPKGWLDAAREVRTLGRTLWALGGLGVAA